MTDLEPRCIHHVKRSVVIRGLLTLLGEKEKQLDAARREIAALEQQIARARPSLWQAEEDCV
jgi:hypothetical protein